MIPGDLTTPGAGAAGAAGAAGEAVKPAIGAEELLDFTRILQKYKAGKARTEQRILASEQWWKLRNSTEEQKVSQIGKDGGFRSVSGWLHNVIVAKHADAMESYPEPNILPREQGDRRRRGCSRPSSPACWSRTTLSGPTPTPCGRSSRRERAATR